MPCQHVSASPSGKEENRSVFFAWLAKQVPSAQLSELYISFLELEKYCRSKKLITQALFEISDLSVIKLLRTRLESARIFRFTNRNASNKMLGALRYYEKYLAAEQPTRPQTRSSAAAAASAAASVLTTSAQSAGKTEAPIVSRTPVVATQDTKSKPVEKKQTTIERYRAYLAQNELDDLQIEYLVKLVIGAESYAKSCGLGEGRISDTDDDQTALLTLQKLIIDDDFIRINKQMEGAYITAIQMYIAMLRTESAKSKTDSALIIQKPASGCESSEHESTPASPKLQPEDELIALFNERRMPYERPQGGTLCLLGDQSCSDFIIELREKGYIFCYNQGHRRPSRWIFVAYEPHGDTEAKSQLPPEMPSPNASKTSGTDEPRQTPEMPSPGASKTSGTDEPRQTPEMPSPGASKISGTDEPRQTPEMPSPGASKISGTDEPRQTPENGCADTMAKQPMIYEPPIDTKTTATALDASSVDDEPVASLSDELQQLLADDDLDILRKALAEYGLLTISQVREHNLWLFMNKLGLYSIRKRQDVYLRVQKKLKPSVEQSPERMYQLSAMNACYQGTTPSEAFAAFCEGVARKYPLKFRLLLDRPYNNQGSVVIHRTDNTGRMLSLVNPIAYVSSQLSIQAAKVYAKWILIECGESNRSIEMLEPKPSAVRPVDTTASESTASVQPAPKPTVPDPLPIRQPASQPAAAPVQPPASGRSEPANAAHTMLIQEAEKILLSADLKGMTLDALYRALNVTMATTKKTVEDAVQIVELANRLVHKDAFVDWEEGAKQLEELLDKLMDRNDGYVSAAQLYSYAHVDMRMFLNDNGIDDERSVYCIAQHLFEKVQQNGKRFAFRQQIHISRADREVVSNVLDIMCKFAHDQGGYFTFAEMESHLESLVISPSNLRMKMCLKDKPIFFCYAENEFLTAESMGLDDAWLKTVQRALARLFEDVGDHIILRDIQPHWFHLLPSLPGDRAWTQLLLQSVLIHYSRALNARTICAMPGQSMDTLHAMLARSDSGIQTFCDAVADVLANEAPEQRVYKAEDLRQLLVKHGMVAGNELILNMPKALQRDERFAWDAAEEYVTVRV